MKQFLILSFIILLFPAIGATQNRLVRSYMRELAKRDLSTLWRGTSIITHSSDGIIDTEPIQFPEPLGYIGNNYQRFYIHYTSVKKDINNPYRYMVHGKTRVGRNVCSFTGTIIVRSASLFKETDDIRFKQGEVVCDIDFKENSTQVQSGFINGKLTTDWCMDKRGHLLYDAINFIADGYSNNQCIAIWTSYKTHQQKTCNWGDFRMPDSNQLDISAGDVSINPEYVRNGWQNYMEAYSYSANKQAVKAALKEEKRQWWK